ncbi:MAG: arsenic resistance protein, partial [Candidatus Methanomethylophilus sp.]|nr:arsenic resistance protein [Methanomethylophilus sp.]
DDTTSLIFTTMARNSPLALAICAAAFPENSVALLILVIGPLIELPTLALAANLRLRRRRRLGLQ